MRSHAFGGFMALRSTQGAWRPHPPPPSSTWPGSKSPPRSCGSPWGRRRDAAAAANPHPRGAGAGLHRLPQLAALKSGARHSVMQGMAAPLTPEDMAAAGVRPPVAETGAGLAISACRARQRIWRGGIKALGVLVRASQATARPARHPAQWSAGSRARACRLSPGWLRPAPPGARPHPASWARSPRASGWERERHEGGGQLPGCARPRP